APRAEALRPGAQRGRRGGVGSLLSNVPENLQPQALGPCVPFGATLGRAVAASVWARSGLKNPNAPGSRIGRSFQKQVSRTGRERVGRGQPPSGGYLSFAFGGSFTPSSSAASPRKRRSSSSRGLCFSAQATACRYHFRASSRSPRCQ